MLSQRIEPFRALRYNPERVADLRAVAAPPYDLIGPERQTELYDRDPHNIVRLELGREQDRYGAATATLASWRRLGILMLDPRPAIYLYSQNFVVGGRKLCREGFVVRIRLEEFGHGRILPHEKTFPAAKEDRLKLLTALQTNVSSVFGLYAKNDERLAGLIGETAKQPPIAHLVDDLGIENQLHAIEGDDAIATLQRALHSPRILIADGHHRYETALNYRHLRRAAEGNPPGLKPYDYTMMTLVAGDDPGLVILPTHRLVARLGSEGKSSFLARAREVFEVEEFTDRDRMRADLMRRGRGTLAVALRSASAAWLLKLRDYEALRRALPDTPDAVRELDVSILHAMIFDRIFGLKPDEVKAGGNIEYTIDASGALDAVAQEKADGAFLMNPPSIADVERVADAGATMPEKSTYFHPKLITGMFMNSLSDE